MKRNYAQVWFSLLLFLEAKSVFATDNYSYQPHEYAIISGGRSPDGRWSVAAHGEGEAGYESFDLYLVREPAHEKPSPLHLDGALDTAPLSIIAVWAPDSRHVVLLHRTDRHVLELRLFAIGNGRVQPVEVPLLFDVVGSSHLKQGVQSAPFSRLYRVVWQRANRFTLQECDTFDADDPIFRRELKPYTTMDRLGPERTFTTFSAEASCEIGGDGKLRFAEVKALPESSWSKTIVYSPHLLFDAGRGLHSTETTLSSLEAEKGSK